MSIAQSAEPADTNQSDVSAQDSEDTAYDGSSDYDDEADDSQTAQGQLSTESQDSDDQGQGDEGEDLTDKGTKKDPNPKSQVHQELANERRARQEAEARLLAYERQLSQPQQQQSQEKKPFVDPEKLTNRQSVAEVLNTLYERLEQQDNLIKGFGSQFGQTREALADDLNQQNFTREVFDSYKDYPELDETSSQYNKALDEKITAIYKRVAYDSQGRLRRDRPSFRELADDYMTAVRAAQGTGEQKARTRVIEKQAGQVNTSKKGAMQVSTDNMSDEEFIAHQLGFTK